MLKLHSGPKLWNMFDLIQMCLMLSHITLWFCSLPHHYKSPQISRTTKKEYLTKCMCQRCFPSPLILPFFLALRKLTVSICEINDSSPGSLLLLSCQVLLTDMFKWPTKAKYMSLDYQRIEVVSPLCPPFNNLEW